MKQRLQRIKELGEVAGRVATLLADYADDIGVTNFNDAYDNMGLYQAFVAAKELAAALRNTPVPDFGIGDEVIVAGEEGKIIAMGIYAGNYRWQYTVAVHPDYQHNHHYASELKLVAVAEEGY